MYNINVWFISGVDSGGVHPARSPPLKFEKKIRIFWRKIVIFHTKYPKNVRALPPQLEKNMIFWRKIVIFHTKYPKSFKCAPPNLKILDPPLYM